MNAPDSAYAALGLRPGARRAEVEQAYRRLIKQHHPDHAGGDCRRAAEINSAYSLLRKAGEWRPPPRAVAVPPRPQPRRRRRGFGTLLLVALVVGGVVFLNQDSDRITDIAWAEPIEAATVAPVEDAAPDERVVDLNRMDEPLASNLIEKAVRDAIDLYGLGDLDFLAEYSRQCTSWMRERPSVAAFDSCTAFDEAVAVLQSADPMYDSGPFSPSALTARQMRAARLLSADSMLADLRARQIRSQVEMSLIARSSEQQPSVGAAAH